MILFIMSGLFFYEDPAVSGDPEVRVVIDILAGQASVCTCPDDSCDKSECRFVDGDDGQVCAGSCSAAELFACADDVYATQTETDSQPSSNQSSSGCTASCETQTKGFSEPDYRAWLDHHLFK